jgi:hypothetical protein
MPEMSGSPTALAVPSRGSPVRTCRGALLGGTLMALVVAARSSGILEGSPAVALLVIACLLIPSSRQLSRRILVAGAVGLGWVPMAWWFPVPLSSLGRMDILLALLVGGLGAWVASGCSPRDRLAALVPQFRPVDILPCITAILSACALRNLLAARTGSRVLTLLIPGWDNLAHYAMVHSIRVTGEVSYQAPWITSGETRPYAMYPQGYHAAVAGTMELLAAPTVGSTNHELVLYAHAEALVVILAVTALAAGICALPRLRRRPAVAAPLVALVVAGFMSGPGATALQNGFPNFVVACALVGIVLLLIAPLQRVISPVILGAIGGAIVGIAYTWALLLVFAIFALATLVMPLSRRRWVASRGQWLAASAIVLAVILCLLAAFNVLSAIPLPLATQLAAGGDVQPPAIGMLITIVLGSASLAVAVFAKARRALNGATGSSASRTAALVLVPVGGMVVAIAIAVLQVHATGKISYYFWKFAIGLELACLIVIVVEVAALITTWPQHSPARRSRTVVTVLSGLLVLADSQSFGYFGPPLELNGGSQTDLPAQLRQSAVQTAIEPNPTGLRLLAALHVQDSDMKRRVIFLLYPSDQLTNPINAEQWYMALTGTYSDKIATAVQGLKPMNSSRSAAADATAILRGDATRLIVVSPDVRKAVRNATDPALRDRIVSW